LRQLFQLKEFRMKLVHTSPHSAQEHLLKNVLESAGIPCVVRNDSLSVVVGEIPAGECWPELWVVDDAHAEEAHRLLQVDATPSDAPHDDWCCHWFAARSLARRVAKPHMLVSLSSATAIHS
jgi:hypothetical protein